MKLLPSRSSYFIKSLRQTIKGIKEDYDEEYFNIVGK